MSSLYIWIGITGYTVYDLGYGPSVHLLHIAHSQHAGVNHQDMKLSLASAEVVSIMSIVT